MPTVSIVIRALNEAVHLPALFEGIETQSIQPDEIVLVDSGSTDDTVAIAEKVGVHVVDIRPEDFSFGRSLNVGCEAALGDLLVFVSAHVYPVDDRWLANLVEPFAHPDVALVYGRQTGDDRSTFSEVEVMRRWFPERSDPDQSEPFCNNANCAVRRSVWEGVRYDETLTGLEDLDWARRAQAAGHRLVYRADAAVVHVHEESWHQTVNRYRREAIAHRRIFEDQGMGAAEAFGLFLATTGRDYLAAVPRRRLRANVGAIPRFRAAQFYGTWQGFRHRGKVTRDLKRRFYYPKGLTALEETRAGC